MFFKRRSSSLHAASFSGIDLRPRFLPDPQLKSEWGPEAALLYRLIRKGFRVPPMASWGATQVDGWLQSLPGYAPAIEAWRLWGNPYSTTLEPVPAAVGLLADLRDQILSAPMPFHFGKGVTTIREMLCGGQKWPIQLRLGSSDVSPSIADPNPYAVWCAFRELVALQFSLERATRALEQKRDPRQLRYPILIQPVLMAELSGIAESEDAERLPENVREDLRAHSKLASASVELHWAFDGEQLWFPFARELTPDPGQPGGESRREITRRPFDSQSPADPASESVLREFLKEARPELERRFGLRLPRLDEGVLSIAGRWYFDPSAWRLNTPLSWTRMIRGGRALLRLAIEWTAGQRRVTAWSEFRLALRLAALERPMSLLRAEYEKLHDRDEAELRQWVQHWRDTHSTDLLGQKIAETRELARGVLARGLAALVIRENLIEALAPLTDLSAEPARDVARLNADWAECVAVISCDPAAAEFVKRLDAEVLDPSSREKWMRFIARYGRLHPSLDLRSGSWAENPAHLAECLRQALETALPSALVPDEPHWRAATRHSAPGMIGNVSQLEQALERAREMGRYASSHRGVAGWLQTSVRQIYLGAGEALVRKQFLRNREDAFYLSLPELIEAFSPEAMTVRFLVERRRADRKAELAAGVIPAGLTQDSGRLRDQLARLSSTEVLLK